MYVANVVLFCSIRCVNVLFICVTSAVLCLYHNFHGTSMPSFFTYSCSVSVTYYSFKVSDQSVALRRPSTWDPSLPMYKMSKPNICLQEKTDSSQPRPIIVVRTHGISNLVIPMSNSYTGDPAIERESSCTSSIISSLRDVFFKTN
jgi:hypothetical protein